MPDPGLSSYELIMRKSVPMLLLAWIDLAGKKRRAEIPIPRLRWLYRWVCPHLIEDAVRLEAEQDEHARRQSP